jgi:plastocyanin
MSAPTQTNTTPAAMRWAVIIAVAGVAFFGTYSFALAQSRGAALAALTGSASTTGIVAASAPAAVSPTVGGGGGCCGGGSRGPAVTGSATVAGGVQKISVDLSSGSYNPNTIQLKAGVPAEITFGQASGCTGVVQSQQLGFSEDLSSGPKTVKLAGLQAGTYQFACGMGMVTGTIVVQ